MSEIDGTLDVDRLVTRIELVMDDAYSRYAASTPAARADGVAAALRATVKQIQPAQRRACLEILADLYDGKEPSGDRTLAVENARLRQEIRHLQDECDKGQRNQSIQTLAQALLPAESGYTIDGDAETVVVIDIVVRLTKFAREMTTMFGAGSERREGHRRSAVDSRFWNALHESVQSGSAEKLIRFLDDLTQDAIAETQAFPAAAREGANDLLARLDPELLAEELTAEKGDGNILDRKVFRFHRLWEWYQKRHAELVHEDVYGEFFDGQLKAARIRLRQSLQEKRRA